MTGGSPGDGWFTCRLAKRRPAASAGRPQVGDAALQEVRQLALLARVEAGNDAGLNLPDVPMALCQQTLATPGQPRFKYSPEIGVGVALDQTGGLEVDDDAVHRLRRHERPACQLRTAQTR